MSPQLHIPLSRHQKTTRRPRWVVWLLAVIFVLSLLLSYHLSQLWFTRPSAFQAAPEDTISAVQLFVNNRTWPVLQKTIGETTLISNRNLTLADVISFTEGEIVWFFGKDGTRSIALRTDEDQIPTEMLDAEHIIKQKISKNVFLFSEKMQPISGVPINFSFRNLLPSFSHTMGMYFDQETNSLSPITYQLDRISISLPQKYGSKNKFIVSNIPEGVYLSLSTPVLTNQPIDESQNNIFSMMVDSLLPQPSAYILESLLSHQGILLLKNPRSPRFLLVSNQEMDEKDRVRFIQTALSLRYPKKIAKILEDRSTTVELISDPSLISVEQRTLEGIDFHHAVLEQTSLYISKAGEFILSDDESLLKNWLSIEKNEKLSDICNGNVAFLHMKNLLDASSYPREFYSIDLLRTLGGSFESVSLESNGNNTKLHMCF